MIKRRNSGSSQVSRGDKTLEGTAVIITLIKSDCRIGLPLWLSW